jgi:hypothetical protein
VTSYEDYRNGADPASGDYGPDEPRGWSPFAVALIATLVLLLGLAGALFGINVANKNKAVAGSTPLPQVVPTVPIEPSTPVPTATPTDTPTAAPTTPPATSPPAGDTFALPDLGSQDFQAARTKVRDLKLGWRLVFEGTGSDARVRVTEPAAGAMVKRGDTVKIVVRGGAPLATVPGVKGLACEQAAALIVDQGLYPAYQTGHDGVVLSQVPESSDPQTLHWNDQVKISCGKAP